MWVGLAPLPSPETAYIKAGSVSHDAPPQLLQNRVNIFSRYKNSNLAGSQKKDQT